MAQLVAGAWSHPYKRMERISGVVAKLGRANPLQTMVDLRRARQGRLKSKEMNRASMERGMFRSEHIRSYKAEVDNKETQDKRRKVDDLVNFGKVPSKIGRVDSLDDDGFPYVGANLQSGEIVIGKCTESPDHSIKLEHTERGVVQKVVLSSNDDGKNFALNDRKSKLQSSFTGLVFQKVEWREFIMDVPVKWFGHSYSWVRYSTNVSFTWLKTK
ncbi:hypothetical protein QYF36_012631 [Acer negundo]|nr:hypothetical protein QYF36_012631 [Acer negundo]